MKCIILICILMLCSGCDKSQLRNVEPFYNSNSGMVCEYENDVYYINNMQLYCGVTDKKKIADDVCLVQATNDCLYYVKKNEDNHFLYKYENNNHIEFVQLPEGIRVICFAVTENTVYVLVDHSLYKKSMYDDEFLELEVNGVFVENKGRIYYCGGYAQGVFDTENDWVTDFSELNLIHTLNIYDLIENKEECIAENTAGFMIAPTRNGIIYYDVETRKTILYRDSKKKTLMKNMITELITDGDSIVYNDLTNTGVYRMYLDTGEIIKICDENVSLLGMTKEYVYTADGEFIKI